jgi:hypothetical protein
MLFLLFRTVGWACIVVIVVVSLVPGDTRPDTGLPGQIDHIISYCGTAGLLGLGYPAAKSRFGTIVMLTSLAATLELAQRWIPGRHPQFIDFAASVVGACLGMLGAVVVHRIALGDLRWARTLFVTTARISLTPDVLAPDEVHNSGTRLDPIVIGMLVSSLHGADIDPWQPVRAWASQEVHQVPSNAEEHEKDSDDDPNIDAGHNENETTLRVK